MMSLCNSPGAPSSEDIIPERFSPPLHAALLHEPAHLHASLIQYQHRHSQSDLRHHIRRGQYCCNGEYPQDDILSCRPETVIARPAHFSRQPEYHRKLERRPEWQDEPERTRRGSQHTCRVRASVSRDCRPLRGRNPPPACTQPRNRTLPP